MMKLALARALAGALLVPCLVLAACATDNGSNVFGDQFAPPGKKLDAGGDDASPVPGATDAGDDASDAEADGDAPPVVTCTGSGTIAVLAGGDTTLSGAVQIDGAAWAGGAITGGGAKSLPAIVAFGSGFLGLTRGPSDVLQSVSVTTTFGTASQIGTVTTIASPALAVVGTTAHVAYLDATNKFFHGTNTGAGWDAATDPVKPSAGTQSFGPSAPALAAAGTDVVFAQDGDNGGFYAQTLSGGSWSTSVQVAAASSAYKPAPPSLVATTGTLDLVGIYVDDTTRRISWSGRAAAGKTWGTPAAVNTVATTDEQLSVAAINASTLLLAFRGQDGKAYTSTGTISGSSIAWTAPAALVLGGVSVDSAPAVAKGVCGDDAIVVFASSGQVKATRLRSGTWSTPESVSGASGARVAVATR
jgi:hypothetical protein